MSRNRLHLRVCCPVFLETTADADPNMRFIFIQKELQMNIVYSHQDVLLTDSKFDPSAVYRVDGERCYYCRGCFYTVATGRNMGYEQCLDHRKIEILIESCINANCNLYSNTPFWMTIKDFVDNGYSVACEYCDKLLGTFRQR